MLEMIPRAGELASKGKPAMLRLVARWFRMPAPPPAPDTEPLNRAERAELARARTINERLDRALKRAYEAEQQRIILEFQVGIRKPDDTPACKEGLKRRLQSALSNPKPEPTTLSK